MNVTEVLSGGTEVIDQISAEWNELCDEGASSDPFLRPEWFIPFVKNFENEIDLVTVRFDGRLRAVLPIVKKLGSLHALPARKLQAAYNLNTPRFDLIHGADSFERRDIVSAVWQVIKASGRWDVLEIRLVKKDSWLVDVLALAESEGYKTGIWQMDSAPFIRLPKSIDKEQSIDNFFKGSRKHLKQELNRRLRRLKELGSVDFSVTSGVTPELMETYFELESKGWKGRGGTAVTDDPTVERMHQEFAAEVAAKRSLLVYELKLNDKTIAMSLNIRYMSETIHWKTAYDEDFARYSPGNLLFSELVCDCIRSGSNEIDFLSPSTKNKRAWSTGEREHVAFYIFNRTLFGSLLSTWKFSVVRRLRHLKARSSGKMVPAQAVR